MGKIEILNKAKAYDDMMKKQEIVNAHKMGGMQAVDEMVNTPAGRQFAADVAMGLAAQQAQEAQQAAMARYEGMPVVEGMGPVNVEPYAEQPTGGLAAGDIR